MNKQLLAQHIYEQLRRQLLAGRNSPEATRLLARHIENSLEMILGEVNHAHRSRW